ncbi:ATP-binding protein [Loktanella sp. S4079]|uniref:ATP-binding protein n=1 Tax=Loktanella sp. S4079 TaxID=579483 RepID=UPI00406CE844
MSVVSAQQLMDAADLRKLNIIPVYLDFEGRFMHGPRLRDLAAFRPRPGGLKQVTFAWGDNGPCINAADGSWSQNIDCVLPVFHGPYGEDGRIQGMMELLGIPVTGFNATNSAIAMRKDATKALVQTVGVNVVDHVIANHATMKNPKAFAQKVAQQIGYPAIVKPANLGSSIGVGIATDDDTLIALSQSVLREDGFALVEPQVQNLVEYNIALTYRDGEIYHSAIERPKTSADLLDFKEKYLASGDGAPPKKGGKLGNSPVPSQGMLSLTRDINPDIPVGLKARIHEYASAAFSVLGLRGAPRIDFMVNSETEELWFNEINPIPGSYGFFLWEAAEPQLLFSELIQHLVEEAISDSLKSFDDPVPQGAHLLPR